MRFIAIPLSLAICASAPALAANAERGCKESATQQAKPPARKPPENRDRKRPASSAVGRGCIGCFVPLDGIASTMAVRQLG